MPRQFMTYQFDLFSAPQRGKTAGTPQWPELPEETRQALTVLIVRLFVDGVLPVSPDRSARLILP